MKLNSRDKVENLWPVFLSDLSFTIIVLSLDVYHLICPHLIVVPISTPVVEMKDLGLERLYLLLRLP